MSGPHPSVAAVRSAVRAVLAETGARAVLVACSGGPDSLALAAATAFTAPRAGVRAGAVVVDHGWHAGSDRVAAGAARTCRGLGLDPVEVFPVHRGHATAGPGGPEARARDARYAALDDARRRHGADLVLLGHTLDDQAETVLLGLARGSGARSLAGMPARRGPYARPLLALPRSTTRQACAALGLTPWEDPANADPAYTRVRARTLLTLLDGDLGPGLPAALARTAELLREDADALDAMAGALLAAARRGPGDPEGSAIPEGSAVIPAPVALDVAVLSGAPPAVRRRALLAAARAAGAGAGALSRRHALAVDALVVRWRGQGPVHLPNGVEARRGCGTLTLAATGRDAVPGAAAGHPPIETQE